MSTSTLPPVAIAEDQRERLGARLPAYSLHMDMARGLAALLVMLAHQRILFFSSQSQPGRTASVLQHDPRAIGIGHYAVVVFFVLSGFLVGGSAMRGLRQGSFSWLRYLTHRFVRLWTVLLPALMVGCIIDSLGLFLFADTYHGGLFSAHLPATLSIKTFLGNALFLQNLSWTHVARYGTNDALWSLSNEFWYYIAFPALLVPFFARSKRTAVLSGAIGCVVLAAMWPQVAAYFTIWLLGCAVFLMPKRIPARLQSSALATALAGFLLLLLLLRRHPLSEFSTDALIGVGFSAVLYAMLHRTQRGGQIYAKAARFLSRPSYTLYLFHLPLSVFVGALRQHHRVAGPLALIYAALASVFVFACCYGLYFCFEVHTDRVRHRAEAMLHLRKS